MTGRLGPAVLARPSSTTWPSRARCVDYDPGWWDVDAVVPTQENVAATEVCSRCVVRVECRDEALEQRAAGVIRGGWRFTITGGRVPFPGDLPATDDPPDQGRPKDAERAQWFIAAGRAYAGGQPAKAVCARFGLGVSTVLSAGRLVRLLAMEQVEQVEQGRLSIRAALKLIAGMTRPGRPSGTRTRTAEVSS